MEEKKEERVTREERFERRGNGWKEMDGGVHEGWICTKGRKEENEREMVDLKKRGGEEETHVPLSFSFFFLKDANGLNIRGSKL